MMEAFTMIATAIFTVFMFLSAFIGMVYAVKWITQAMLDNLRREREKWEK